MRISWRGPVWAQPAWLKRLLTKNVDVNVSSSALLVIFFFLALMVFTWPEFFRNLGEINQFDETNHINKGRMLVEGGLPIFSENPAVAAFYGVIYVFSRDNALWLLEAGNIGRTILFASLFWTLWLVSREALGARSAMVCAGLFVVLPVGRNLLQNSSDALFTVLCGLSLWGIIRFSRADGLGYLTVCSVFVALAALSRNDGLTMFPIMVGLASLVGAKRHGWYRIIIASVTPAVILVAGYVSIFWIATGQISLGTFDRTYFAFEQGQGIVYSEMYAGKNSFVEGQYTARSLYGTPEENQHSVWQAIGRNPKAFTKRMCASVTGLPMMVFKSYGSRINYDGFCDEKLDTGLGVLLVIFGVWGAVVLWRKGNRRLVVILALWPAFILAYLVTFFRPGYLIMPFYSLLVLASACIEDLVDEVTSPKKTALAYSVLLCSSVAFWVLGQPQTVRTFALVAIGFAVAKVYRRDSSDVSASRAVCLLIMFVAGVASSAPSWSAIHSSSGITFREEAALVMRNSFVQRSVIATYADGVVVLARMRPKLLQIQFSPDLRRIHSGADLHKWLIRNRVVGVYVDSYLRKCEPHLCGLIRAELGTGLRLLYESDGGEAMVAGVVRRQRSNPK